MSEKPTSANKSRKPRPIVCWETGEVFPSLRAAAKAVGIVGSGMIGVAAREGGKAGGYHWYYEGSPRPDASTFKNPRKRPVICYETGEEFESAAAAARAIGGEGGLPDIDAAARDGGMAGGYHWYYKDRPRPKPGELKGNKPVVCWETGEEFSSTQEAADWAGTTASGIYTAIRCRSLSGGYHWYFLGSTRPDSYDDGGNRSRPVVCWETEKVFPTAKQAADAVGLKWAESLKPALEHPHRTAGGFHWYYADQPKPNSSALLKKSDDRAVVCWETNAVYESAEAAAKAMGLKNSSSIRGAISNPRRTAGGYHWYRANQPKPSADQLQKKRRRGYPVACWETDEVFENAAEAAAAVGLTSASSICHAVLEHRRMGGYFWYRPDQPKPKKSELKQTKQRAQRKPKQQ